MQSCSSALCILILISTFTTLSESCFTSVKVKLHDSAVLPCYGRCSVWGRWTALGNPDDVLAECDQTSCRSVKEGNQMIHDQYLKGNLSLTISDAVFSQRTWYTCKCESHNICDVSVQTELPPQIHAVLHESVPRERALAEQRSAPNNAATTYNMEIQAQIKELLYQCGFLHWQLL
ncbi:uncharacterized protein LOC118826996 isoform X2 [Colossoma macropomum]|uniref:uncharacterized protein LOC118826996 isoform X2 n=1 Tax=Colossoma macropomum TaxID=42526 RepID=UPI0018654F98|nr:uncharacterized protein LOC118826996 isoform X2 [Colossoma macropomum]